MHETLAIEFIAERKGVNLRVTVCWDSAFGVKSKEHDIEEGVRNRWNNRKEIGWVWEEVATVINNERREWEFKEWIVRSEISFEATGVDNNGVVWSA